MNECFFVITVFQYHHISEAAAMLFAEEVNNDGSDPGDQSRTPVLETPAVVPCEEEPSFRNVFSSTPKLPLTRPEYTALNLSRTLADADDEPLNLSVRTDVDNPIDLVVAKSECITKSANVIGPLNLIVAKSDSTPIKEDSIPIPINQDTIEQSNVRQASMTDVEGIAEFDLLSGTVKIDDHNYASKSFLEATQETSANQMETVIPVIPEAEIGSKDDPIQGVQLNRIEKFESTSFKSKNADVSKHLSSVAPSTPTVDLGVQVTDSIDEEIIPTNNESRIESRGRIETLGAAGFE